jgi:acyl-CoA dehydrogenase
MTEGVMDLTSAQRTKDPSRRAVVPPFTADHERLRLQMRSFVTERLRPHADEWEEAQWFPNDVFRWVADAGYLGLGLTDPIAAAVWVEELARCGSGGLAAGLGAHTGIALPPIARFGTKDQRERYVVPGLRGELIAALAITEPGAGSDVAGIRTQARRVDGGYVVNGSKMFITGGMRADYFTTAVRTGGHGMGGISLLLIESDRKGVARTNLKKQGWWASDTAAIYFDDVRVPKANLIGGENQGFMGIMLNFNGERLGMAASANAAARVCIEEAVKWAQQRHTFGKRLADHQVIRHKIAEMVRHVNATQAYLEICTWRVQNGETPAADLALLKVQATQTMEFCAREAMQILGGAGYMRGNKVERIYREVRVNAIGGGSEEIMRDLAARQLGL